MSGIFISYRRSDSSGEAGRLYDSLEARLGKEHVFRDVDTMRGGIDWVERLESKLAEVDAMVVVIGPGWPGVEDERGRPRLEDPEDYVRREVEAALRRGILTVPVLVRHAVMPSSFLPDALKPLARVQAFELSDRRWRADVDELVELLSSVALSKEEPLREQAIEEKRQALRDLPAIKDRARQLAETRGSFFGEEVGVAQPLSPGERGPDEPLLEEEEALAQALTPHERPLRIEWADVYGTASDPVGRRSRQKHVILLTDGRLLLARGRRQWSADQSQSPSSGSAPKRREPGQGDVEVAAYAYDQLREVSLRFKEIDSSYKEGLVRRRRVEVIHRRYELRLVTNDGNEVIWDLGVGARRPSFKGGTFKSKYPTGERWAEVLADIRTRIRTPSA